MSTTVPAPAGRRHRVAVPLPADADLSPATAGRLAALPPLNVTRMLANTEDMYEAVLGLVRAVFTARDVTPRLREIITLRAAYILNVPYEWQANIPMALNTGVTEDEIRHIASDGPVTRLDPNANLVCRATDEISRDVAVSDPTLQQLLDEFGAKVTTKYILAICWFNLLSRFLASTRVPSDTGSPTSGRDRPL